MLNSYDITKQSIVYGMFNQYLFSEAKNNIDLIEKFFMTDPSTMTNTLIRDLLHAIREYDLQYIDEPMFRSILANQGKTDTESNEILGEIMKYKRYSSDQIDPIRKYVRGIGSQSLINAAIRLYPNDPESYVKYIKTHEYKFDMSDVFVTMNFDQLDLNSIQANSFSGWPSAFQFINDSFMPMRKYENGQIVMVVAPPGCFTGDTKVRVRYLGEELDMTMEELSKKTKVNEYWTYCYNLDSDRYDITRVVDCWITRYVYTVLEVKVKSSRTDEVTSFRCTHDHRILRSNNKYLTAMDLREGDEVKGRNDTLTVIGIDEVTFDEKVPVYDLTVSHRHHNFLLSSGAFVHNCGKTLVK